MNFVTEALELEDTIKNYEHCSSNGWKYESSFRPARKGRLGPCLDVIELMWRCILRKQLQKLLAIVLGCMSAAILVAEATILPNGVDLSLFSILVNVAETNEVLVQVAAFVPLMYMCVCTYYSLFKIGMLTFYYLTPRQTSSVSLLMICSMVARYAPPISYNFLNLIHLDNAAKTIFEKRMGNIDDAVPFFGKGFNKVYPVFMVIYTILVANNFFDRVINYFGNWEIFRSRREASDDLDGFDPSGLIILQKERSWLQQGHKVGELVVPLARSFSNAIDLEPGSHSMVAQRTQASRLMAEEGESSHSGHLKDPKREGTSRTDLAMRSRESQASSSHDAENSSMQAKRASPRIASTWESVKTGFQNFKSRIDAKRFIPLGQAQDAQHDRVSSSESLDQIFERIRQPSARHTSYGDDDDDDDDDDNDDFEMTAERLGHSQTR